MKIKLPKSRELTEELIRRLQKDPRGHLGQHVQNAALIAILILDIRIEQTSDLLGEMLLRRRRARLITRTHRSGMGGLWLKDQQELEHVLTVAIRALLSAGGRG